MTLKLNQCWWRHFSLEHIISVRNTKGWHCHRNDPFFRIFHFFNSKESIGSEITNLFLNSSKKTPPEYQERRFIFINRKTPVTDQEGRRFLFLNGYILYRTYLLSSYDSSATLGTTEQDFPTLRLMRLNKMQ